MPTAIGFTNAIDIDAPQSNVFDFVSDIQRSSVAFGGRRQDRRRGSGRASPRCNRDRCRPTLGGASEAARPELPQHAGMKRAQRISQMTSLVVFGRCLQLILIDPPCWRFPARPRYNLAMTEPVARVHIKLLSVRPMVWRRVDVPLSSTLAALHDVIQIAMGWTDSHLHEFKVGERVYGMPDPGYDLDDRRVYKDSSIRLKTVIERGFRRFHYLYDLGDHWEHEITVEEVRDGEAGIEYPTFVEGARRCPPEDVGAARGFMSFLEAALDPAHEEHRSMIEWYGKPYDPADIDERLVRMGLQTIARARRGVLASHQSGRRPDGTGDGR
ncbi:MAG: plasmid pRiA4b ORF-3 family protein [Chloroflexi bacterium]|nr:plasmid pRiA4b ORF-3 family protein [Chloroflexota bacterium]